MHKCFFLSAGCHSCFPADGGGDVEAAKAATQRMKRRKKKKKKIKTMMATMTMNWR